MDYRQLTFVDMGMDIEPEEKKKTPSRTSLPEGAISGSKAMEMLELSRHLVRFFTKKGMKVLDPFGGVGSTAKAC